MPRSAREGALAAQLVESFAKRDSSNTIWTLIPKAALVMPMKRASSILDELSGRVGAL
jgi:hypothetical protein